MPRKKLIFYPDSGVELINDAITKENIIHVFVFPNAQHESSRIQIINWQEHSKHFYKVNESL